MLRVIVTYDISNDKLRKKVSDSCLDYGLDRSQFSVFTGRLKAIHIRALSKRLNGMVKSGHVLIIPVAADDWEKRVEIGKAEAHDEDEE
jgi:CRISPR-associated protein Cas2